MKNLSLATSLLFLFLFSSCSNSNKMEGGKVYVLPDIDIKPKRGEYLILDRKGKNKLHFKTFDLVDNKPVGNLGVSLPYTYDFKEVELSREFMLEAYKACNEREKQERENTLASMNMDTQKQAAELRKKYKVNENLIFHRFTKDPKSDFEVGTWLDEENKNYVIQVYLVNTIVRECKIRWRSNPQYSKSFDDQQTIIDSMQVIFKELGIR